MKRMLVVPSKSRYALMVERLGSESAARRWFGETEVWDTVLESHRAQQRSIALLREGCADYGIAFVDRSCLADPATVDAHDIFAFAGGDNHFTYCAQEILQYQRGRPLSRKDVIGVILDSHKSLGALLQTGPEGFLGMLPRLSQGDYRTSAWTTLEATVRVNGTVSRPYPAVGDYFVGERDRMKMSRNKAYLGGAPVLLEKSSGLLVVTGAGAGDGSWYDNPHAILYGKTDALAREDCEAHVIVTENKQAVDPRYGKAVLMPRGALHVFSYNDDCGILCPDSHAEHSVPFMIGAKAEIRIGDMPLRVIAP